MNRHVIITFGFDMIPTHSLVPYLCPHLTLFSDSNRLGVVLTDICTSSWRKKLTAYSFVGRMSSIHIHIPDNTMGV